MVINETTPLIGAVASGLSNLWQFVTFLLGGVVGIYIIMTLVRIYAYRRYLRELKLMRRDLKKIKNKLRIRDEKKKRKKK